MKYAALKSVALLAGLSFLAPARADVASEMQHLSSVKQSKQQELEVRFNVLQQERACVMSAMTMAALQSCEQMSRQILEQLQAQQQRSLEAANAVKLQQKDSQ